MRRDIHYRPTKPTVRAKPRKHSLIHHFGDKLAKRDGGYYCHYCAIPLVRANPHKPNAVEDWKRRGKGIGTVDHVVPLSKGGSNKLENLVLACYTCNIRKADSNYRSFIKMLEYEQMLKNHQQERAYLSNSEGKIGAK